MKDYEKGHQTVLQCILTVTLSKSSICVTVNRTGKQTNMLKYLDSNSELSCGLLVGMARSGWSSYYPW